MIKINWSTLIIEWKEKISSNLSVIFMAKKETWGSYNPIWNNAWRESTYLRKERILIA